MTAQIADSLLWAGVVHEIIAVENPGLFSPVEHGLTPVAPHTACWRGYVAHYAVASEALVLRRLAIGCGMAAPPIWRGIAPRRDDGDDMWEYGDVELPVPYSGGVVIGSGLTPGFYVHLGFQPAYAYESVLELAFSDGHVETVADRSLAMARLRNVIARAGELPQSLVLKWLTRVFSGAYEADWF